MDVDATDVDAANGDAADGEVTDGEVTDEELTALALAGDPDAVVADDAVCVWDLLGARGKTGARGLLPEWYMPATMDGARPERKRWHRRVALLVIVSFLLIDAFGLCITYGTLVAA